VASHQETYRGATTVGLELRLQQLVKHNNGVAPT